MNNRINEFIRGVKEVRLVGDNVEQGIYSIGQARQMAEEQGLDLVEISATAVPPVCKIIDYQKFLYQQKKKEKEMKSKSHQQEVKTITLHAFTDDHDLDYKSKQANKFLQHKDKVKINVDINGRSKFLPNVGEDIIEKFISLTSDFGKVEGNLTSSNVKGILRKQIIIAPK